VPFDADAIAGIADGAVQIAGGVNHRRVGGHEGETLGGTGRQFVRQADDVGDLDSADIGGCRRLLLSGQRRCCQAHILEFEKAGAGRYGPIFRKLNAAANDISRNIVSTNGSGGGRNKADLQQAVHDARVLVIGCDVTVVRGEKAAVFHGYRALEQASIREVDHVLNSCQLGLRCGRQGKKNPSHGKHTPGRK